MIGDTPPPVVVAGRAAAHHVSMSAPWDDDGGFVWEQREAGRTWEQIGSELGCPPHVARELGERYRADCDARAARDQIPLFDLPAFDLPATDRRGGGG